VARHYQTAALTNRPACTLRSTPRAIASIARHIDDALISAKGQISASSMKKK